jgi:hypothetical protein
MFVFTWLSSVLSSSSKTKAADFLSWYEFAYANPKPISSSGGIHGFSASFVLGGSTGSLNFLADSSPTKPERSDDTKSTASPDAFAFAILAAYF